jgi:penicillin-binding protein 1A
MFSERIHTMNYSHEKIEQKQKSMSSNATKTKRRIGIYVLQTMLLLLCAIIIAAIGIGIGTIQGIIKRAPDISAIEVQPTGFASTIYDQDNDKIQKLSYSGSNRIYKTIDEIPQNLQNAFIAIEDERFYEHHGVDIQGVSRAIVSTVKSGSLSQGGSTITQQLLKNNVFSVYNEDSVYKKIERKIQEQYLAMKVEKELDKPTILEYYLNTINLGQGTLGVEAASNRYFNKTVSQLNLAECAVIASITQSPTGLNPITNPASNRSRQRTVLEKMLEQKMISKKAYDRAINDTVYDRIQQIDISTHAEQTYSYFTDALIIKITEDLQKEKGYTQTQAFNMVYSGGLKIYSTQDSQIQSICDATANDIQLYPDGSKYALNYRLSIKKANGEVVNYSEQDVAVYYQQHNDRRKDLLFTSEKDAKMAATEFKQARFEAGDTIENESVSVTIQPQVSITIIDQTNGQVKALVGGRGEKSGNLTFNRATSSTRQPGSTFKILSTFVPALDTAGMTLATTFEDEPYTWPGTKIAVTNYYDMYRGPSSIRDAIRDSMNVVTAKAMEEVTPQVGYDYLQSLGFSTLVENETREDGKTYTDIQYPLCLGGITNGVTNLELTAAFASIANQGSYIEPTLYTLVLDQDGNELLKNTPSSRQVMKDSTAWLLTNAMEDVVTTGTGKAANIGKMPSAGKTGTTSNNLDHWFAGFTPYYTSSVWIGYDNNQPCSIGNTHMKLWKTIMSKINKAKELEVIDFPTCSSISTASICKKSGKLAVPGVCAKADILEEYFAVGTIPTDECTHTKS